MKREPQDVSEGSAEPRQIQPASVFRGPFVALMLRCGRHCWQATSRDNYPNRTACRPLSFLFHRQVTVGQAFLPLLLHSDSVGSFSFPSTPLEKRSRTQSCLHQEKWSASSPPRTTTNPEPFTKPS